MAARKMRRQSKDGGKSLDAFTEQLQERGLLRNREVIFTDPNGPELSAVLLEFIEPYKKDAPTREAYEKLVTLAIISWNAAIHCGEKRKEYVQIMVNTIVGMAGEEWRRDAESIIEMMIKRKDRYFSDDKRYIADYRLTETDKVYHLAVASLVGNG